MDSTQRKVVALLVLAVLLAPASLTQIGNARGAHERRLSFYHTHTRESLDIVFFENGEYIESALEEINRYLRDFRTGDVAIIDPKLLDLIYEIRESLGSNGTYEVISAYRSPKTNQILRNRSKGVVKNSQHLLGTAIDVRLEDVPTKKLRDAALAMERGGVGYYRISNFVHIDTGRVRRW
jgi:uncharacterized protein YcbK (DUF882 family)